MKAASVCHGEAIEVRCIDFVSPRACIPGALSRVPWHRARSTRLSCEALQRKRASVLWRTRCYPTHVYLYTRVAINPCCSVRSQTGSPRVVQRNRLSSDTPGVGIGDTEGVVERVGCVGGYICRVDCLGAQTAIASILLLLRTRFLCDPTSPMIYVRKRQLQISIRGSAS